MTEFITTFDNIDIANVEDYYNPDFTLQRRPNSHTMRKPTHHYSQYEHVVDITRPECPEGIYVTDMDECLSDKIFRYNYSNSSKQVVLHKKDLYERFVFEIEEKCVEKTISYDKLTCMNKTKYKVPAIGVLVGFTENSPYKVNQKAADLNEMIQKFIMIRGKMYPVGKYFRENGLEYSELDLPVNYFSTQSLCEDGETRYCPTKTDISKEVLTYSFHHDMKISSIILQPGLMKFKRVSSDNRISRYDRMNPLLLRKKNHHINVLENDPGFISKFEMFYRSDLTNGQWVKHGIFNGNVTVTDFTKISFDEIVAKEIRIIPLCFHKSCENIRVTFIGKCKVQPKSDEIFVTYEVSVPRDGKYMKYSTKVCDSNVNTAEARDWKKYMMQHKKREERHQMRERIVYDA
jgi:hypothetical protein